jgi:transcriptional regulator with XRE-family HTH domain
MAKRPLSALKKLRVMQNLTQQDLAEALGITPETVSNWERGRAIPTMTVPQFKTLLRVLKVSPEELPDDFGPIENQPEKG